MESQEKAENRIKLYIAISMRGKSYEEIEEEMRTVAKSLHFDADNCEFVNLLAQEASKEHTPVECLGLSITQLERADAVIIAKAGTGRGVSCEEYICNKYHIPYTKVFYGE